MGLNEHHHQGQRHVIAVAMYQTKNKIESKVENTFLWDWIMIL
jgi:hypothetical protein